MHLKARFRFDVPTFGSARRVEHVAGIPRRVLGNGRSERLGRRRDRRHRFEGIGLSRDQRNPLPGQTATGLIQFTIATLRNLGWTGTRDAFAELGEVAQLPYVEKYYALAFPTSPPARPVDYYVVTWGARPGLSLDHALALRGERKYDLNWTLDIDKDGAIRVSDLDVALRGTIAKAGGARLPTGKGQAGESATGSPGVSSLLSDSVFLPRLQAGNHGVAVEVWRELLIASLGGFAHLGDAPRRDVFDDELAIATRMFQTFQRIDPDGVVDVRQTWPAMLRFMRARASR